QWHLLAGDLQPARCATRREALKLFSTQRGLDLGPLGVAAAEASSAQEGTMIDRRLVCLVGLGIALTPLPVLASGNVTVTTSGGNVKLAFGAGTNSLVVDSMSTIDGKVSLKAGDGDDSVSFDNDSTVGADAKLTLGAGTNSVIFDSGNIQGKLAIKSGDGNDD